MAEPPDRVVVIGRVGDGAWSDAPTEARADQQAELSFVVFGHRGKQRVVRAPAGITRARVDGHDVKPEPLDGARVQWSTVEPHGFRTSKASNGATSEFYSNVSTEPKTFGHWLGFDHIDYFETIVKPWGEAATIPAAIVSAEPDAMILAGLGTTRYKVEVDRGGTIAASPGADATDTYGITRAVHRVSIRRGDDFLGQLTGYLLVPEVFGSAGSGIGHQTDRFTGADCADVMVGALRRMGSRTEYTNVAGLPELTTVVARSTLLDEHGVPDRPITGVKVGDLIRIDYGGALAHHTPRDWDHVAALWEDRSDPAGPFHGGPDGQLDGFDLVIHMGHPRLAIEPLAQQAPATVDVLRWRQK
jgi:hypothetical protein